MHPGFTLNFFRMRGLVRPKQWNGFCVLICVVGDSVSKEIMSASVQEG
jgi:hypothetical protein